MRTNFRRSQFVGILALWLAALLMGSSLAVVPQLSTVAQTPAKGTAAKASAHVTAPAEALGSRKGRFSKLRVSRTVPIRTEQFTVSGSISTKVVRTVTLQRLSGRKWVKVRSAKTSARGAFALPVTTTASSVRYRVSAPKAKVAGKTYPKATSSSIRLRTVGVSPASPMAGETVSISYALDKSKVKKKRSVIVQRKVGNSWVKVGSGTVSRTGSVKATAVLTTTSTLRVRAPKVKIKKKTYRATSSKSFRVSVAPQSVSLAMPAAATVGTAVNLVVEAAPLRAGRTISIQQRSGATWTTVISGAQTAAKTTLRLAPQTAGTMAYRAVMSGYHGASAMVSPIATVTVQPADPGAPVIAITSLNIGVSGTSYNAVLTSTGGTGNVTWSASGLPAGLSLSAAGELSGTPTESGTFLVTFTATDESGRSGSQTILLVVNPAVSVATTALDDGVVGSDYALTLQAAGGTAPFTWTVDGLPAGLSFDGVDTISGQPTATGTSSVTVEVTDHNGKTDSATLELVVVDPLVVTTTALDDGEVGDDYSAQLLATGGDGTYTWTVTAGSLPAGLQLSTAGAITGVPTAIESQTFTVTVTDVGGREESAELTLTVNGLVVTTSDLAEGTAGEPYSQTLAASGGDGSYTWSVTGGTLPDGLTLATNGTLSGTPTAAASVEITFTVTDGRSRTAQAVLRVVVAGDLQISTSALAAGVVGDGYSVTLAAAGGSGDYTWAATGLPDGITLSGGTLTGVPTAEGTSSVGLTVTDGLSRTATATLSLVVGPAVSITTATLPYALTSAEYSATLAATGGTSPYTWSATGLPEGITLEAATGTLSGTAAASAVGTSSVVVTVTDAHDMSATSAVLLTVQEPVSVTTSTLAEATVGAAYSQTLAAGGGRSPYTWSATSELPDGVSLSADGVLSGTPTAAGDTSIEVTATDSSDPALSGTRTVTFTVKDPVAIVTTTVDEGTVDVAYEATLATSGGTGPFSWAIAAGSLPTGLELSTGGKISGTPTASGSATAALKVTDHVGRSAVSLVTVTVKVPVAITTTSLAEGTVGAAYDVTLTAEGGTGPYTWATEADLPDGMTLSESGALGGSPTTPASAATVKVKVTDSVGRTASKTLTVKISGPLTMSTSSLPDGIAADSYSTSLEAAGGSGDYTWSATGLPSGVTLSGATLSGTPASAGTYQVSISVSDEGGRTVTNSFSLLVGPALAVATTSLPNAVTTMGYTASLAASGGAGTYTWTADQLPAGLELEAATGKITGMPTNPDDHTMSVVVTVEDAHHKTASATVSITVLVPVAVVESTLPEATVGAAYDVTLTPGGGTAAYTWSTSSTLPQGMSFSAAGQFTGTPTESGSFDIVVNVVDSSDPQLSGSTTLTLTVADPLAITTASLPAGTVGVAYEQSLAASGGTVPMTWSVDTGSLPAGVSLTASGTISGTPTAAGASTVTVKVTDLVGRAATKEYTVVVADPVAITTTSLADGTTTVAYSQTLAATGGDGSYTWAVTAGGLPEGFSLATDGTLSGTPSAVGATTFTVTATDATGRTATADLTLSVATPVAISTTSLDSPLQGEAYSQTLSASGGVGPYTWQVTGMPSGLSVDPGTGEITGAPSESGAFTFAITATDTKSRTATANIAVNVTPAVSVTTTSLADAFAGTDYSQTVAASGGTAPYQWAATGLPTGLSINAGTGVISGKTTVTKSSTVTVTVTDAHTKTSTRELTLWVEGVEALTAGDNHTCALLSSGGVKCWGLNDYGQLGNGTTTDSSVPVPVTGLSSGVTQISAGPGSHTCAVLTTGAVKCWGWNADGELGDGTTTDRSTPTQVSGLSSGVTAVAAGHNSTCALVSGAMKCWGNNAHGGLGDTTITTRLTPVQVNGLTSGVTAISTGYQYACAVLSTGAVKCWGEGDSGRIGDGYTSDRWAPVQVSGLTSGATALRTGDNHTCAVVAGAAKCWGAGTEGQLGDGASTSRYTPTQVSGLTSGVTAIMAGRFHTCGLQSGAVKCWGRNGVGQLGDSTTTTRSTPVQVAGLTSGVTGIAAGYQHGCAVVASQAYCWGLNTSGQLGVGNLTTYSTPQKAHLFS